MSTDCAFTRGPMDGKILYVKDVAEEVSVPGFDRGRLVSHKYERISPDRFKFLRTVVDAQAYECRTNLDYVLGLREHRDALEAENAKLREACQSALGTFNRQLASEEVGAGFCGDDEHRVIAILESALSQDDKPSHDEAAP